MKQKGLSNFSGKRIWLIGASSGIGEACAKSLLHVEAKVAISSRRIERLNQIALLGGAEQVMVLPLDVTHESQLENGYQHILNTFAA